MNLRTDCPARPVLDRPAAAISREGEARRGPGWRARPSDSHALGASPRAWLAIARRARRGGPFVGFEEGRRRPAALTERRRL